MDSLIVFLGIILLVIGKRMKEADGGLSKQGKTMVLAGKILIGIVVTIFLVTFVYSCSTAYYQRSKLNQQNEEQKLGVK